MKENDVYSKWGKRWLGKKRRIKAYCCSSGSLTEIVVGFLRLKEVKQSVTGFTFVRFVTGSNDEFEIWCWLW